MVKIEIEISEEAYNLLLDINKLSYIEYRDNYLNVDEFKKTNPDRIDDVDRFLNRNNGGTLELAYELYYHRLVDDVDGSWHTSFKISDFGKKVIRDKTINNILNE